ncbi:hypothetical protein AALP_AA8G089400 [Arabis alpina]|uniref:PUM-HD domain-containing protein n=1 Tax=Arabis alpina TaxID=50452 RepID=A0A087G5W2_ARAAL|nr:hypothetical protein AALP_AA8G089400 [Arabis alpina]
MSKDNGKNPISNDHSKNPIPNDHGKDHMFTKFSNLKLHCNNNNFKLGKSSDNQRGESSNNNHSVTVQYNLGRISLEDSRLSGANSRPSPSWITQPGTSTNSSKILASSSQSFPIKTDLEYLRNLLVMMTCPTRFSEFQGYLEIIDTYDQAHKVKVLYAIGSILTRNHFTFVELATNNYGAQALKTLLKRNPSLFGFIYEAVLVNFSVLMNGKFSHHLIVDAIRAVDRSKKEMLYELTYINALFLAEQENGCIALNNVFQEIKGVFREQIFHLIAQNADRLAFDPYGTHVVQNFVTLKNPSVTHAIAERLHGNFFQLAMERQGSYLVEKCLKSDQGMEIVLMEFRGNDREWVRLATHKFGNFVAQCALIVMKKRGMKGMLREFVEKLRPHFADLKLGHGRNTLKFIEEEIEDYLLEVPYNQMGFMP